MGTPFISDLEETKRTCFVFNKFNYERYFLRPIQVFLTRDSALAEMDSLSKLYPNVFYFVVELPFKVPLEL